MAELATTRRPLGIPCRLRRRHLVSLTAVATGALLSLGWQAPTAVAEAGLVPFASSGHAPKDFLATLPRDLGELGLSGDAELGLPLAAAAPHRAAGGAPAAPPLATAPVVAPLGEPSGAPHPTTTATVAPPAPAVVAPPASVPAPVEGPVAEPDPAVPVPPAPEEPKTTEVAAAPSPPPAALEPASPAVVFGEASMPATVSEAAFLSHLNSSRAAVGASALQVDAALRDAAQRWAETLAAAGTLSHQPLGPFLAAGFTTVAENVAAARDVDTAYRALTASPPHYANLTNGAYRFVGIGVAQGADGRLFTAHAFAG